MTAWLEQAHTVDIHKSLGAARNAVTAEAARRMNLLAL